MASSMPATFTLISSSGPRLGLLNSTVPTPRSFPITRRAVIPHLYPQPRDVDWAMIPFESFLENDTPLPVLVGLRQLTSFNGIVHLSARDPRDVRDMPPNNKDGVNAICIQGVRKLTSSDWASYAHLLKPSMVSALSDTPFPVSTTQKRITKSLERTVSWLYDLIKPNPQDGTRLNVLCPLQGFHSEKAREAFSRSLTEELFEPRELDIVTPYKNLNDCLAGYILECAPLRPTPNLAQLLNASLRSLSPEKLRVASLTSCPSPRNPNAAFSTTSPHEILSLIDQVGIDLFDADAWAVECAEIGIGLDFTFPAPTNKDSGQQEIGHNIYLSGLSMNFDPLAPSCKCSTCHPIPHDDFILHSTLDEERRSHSSSYPHTKAYIHHLLQTHEMSAHSLLARHNLAIIDTFFSNVRDYLGQHSQTQFQQEIENFNRTYSLPTRLLEGAFREWKRVEYERGRGRLAREKEKEQEQKKRLDEAAADDQSKLQHFADLALEEQALETQAEDAFST